MAATNLQVNWSAVGFTPSGGSLTAINKVDGVDIDYGTTLLSYSGDADRYPTTIVNTMNEPKMTVRSSNVAGLQGFTAGTVGAFAATHNDAKLAVGGAVVYTLANAVVGNVQVGGEHAQYGKGSLAFQAFSADGVTSPLSFTRS
jgi:hypothetical protein